MVVSKQAVGAVDSLLSAPPEHAAARLSMSKCASVVVVVAGDDERSVHTQAKMAEEPRNNLHELGYEIACLPILLLRHADGVDASELPARLVSPAVACSTSMRASPRARWPCSGRQPVPAWWR